MGNECAMNSSKTRRPSCVSCGAWPPKSALLRRKVHEPQLTHDGGHLDFFRLPIRLAEGRQAERRLITRHAGILTVVLAALEHGGEEAGYAVRWVHVTLSFVEQPFQATV